MINGHEPIRRIRDYEAPEDLDADVARVQKALAARGYNVPTERQIAEALVTGGYMEFLNDASEEQKGH